MQEHVFSINSNFHETTHCESEHNMVVVDGKWPYTADLVVYVY